MLKDALLKVRKGYTPKDLFKLKLTGEAVNVLRETLARELDSWLMEREIFEPVDFDNAYSTGKWISLGKGGATYRCLYPVRIWHVNGRGGNEQINVDHMKPGDIWGF